MIPLIPILGPWLVKKLLDAKPGRTEPRAEFLAKAIQTAFLIALLVAGLLVFDWHNDRAAVREHERERVEQALEATNEADSNDAGRRAAAEAQSDSTAAELQAIRSADPQSTSRPAPAGVRAVANRLPKGE